MKDEHHHGPNEPLHNRVLEMVLLNAILTSFVTFFAILRLVVVYRSKKRWMLADYFLMAAIVSLPPTKHDTSVGEMGFKALISLYFLQSPRCATVIDQEVASHSADGLTRSSRLSMPRPAPATSS
jgi:hypothetical protein